MCIIIPVVFVSLLFGNENSQIWQKEREEHTYKMPSTQAHKHIQCTYRNAKHIIVVWLKESVLDMTTLNLTHLAHSRIKTIIKHVHVHSTHKSVRGCRLNDSKMHVHYTTGSAIIKNKNKTAKKKEGKLVVIMVGPNGKKDPVYNGSLHGVQQ